MKISQEVRDHARAQNDVTDMTPDEIQAGLEQKSKEFKEKGSEIYQKID